MAPPEDQPLPLPQDELEDITFQQQMQRLHELTVYGRWLVVGLLWLTIAPPSLWNLRAEFDLWQQYFTWTAVRYSLAFHPFAAVGLSLCIGATVTVLIWQSRNILWGISDRQTHRLRTQLFKIRQQGNSHPLWKWVMEEENPKMNTDEQPR